MEKFSSKRRKNWVTYSLISNFSIAFLLMHIYAIRLSMTIRPQKMFFKVYFMNSVLPHILIRYSCTYSNKHTASFTSSKVSLDLIYCYLCVSIWMFVWISYQNVRQYESHKTNYEKHFFVVQLSLKVVWHKCILRQMQS